MRYSAVRRCQATVARVTNVGARHTRAAADDVGDRVMVLQQRFETGQGGLMRVEMPSVRAHVQVLPMWAEHTEVEVYASEGEAAPVVDRDGVELCVREADASSRTESAGAGTSILIRLLVPQICDVSVSTGGGNVLVADKLEGSLSVLSRAGDIDVNKVQGQFVHLDACDANGRGGRIDVRKVLEGELALRGSVIECRRLQGPSATLVAPPPCASASDASASAVSDGHDSRGEISRVAVKSMFIAGDICVESDGHVELGSVQGALDIVSGGRIAVESLTGAMNAVGGGEMISVHVDALAGPCSIRATRGDAEVSLASPIETAVALHARAVDFDRWEHFTRSDAGEAGAATATANAGELERVAGHLSVGSDAASAAETPTATSTDVGSASGSTSASRVKRNSGKISKAGQQRAAVVAAAAATRTGRAAVGGADGEVVEENAVRVTAEEGRATLRILSWIDMMRRKLDGLK